MKKVKLFEEYQMSEMVQEIHRILVKSLRKDKGEVSSLQKDIKKSLEA